MYTFDNVASHFLRGWIHLEVEHCLLSTDLCHHLRIVLTTVYHAFYRKLFSYTVCDSCLVYLPSQLSPPCLEDEVPRMSPAAVAANVIRQMSQVGKAGEGRQQANISRGHLVKRLFSSQASQ